MNTNGSLSYNRSPGDDGLYPVDTKVTITCAEGYLVSDRFRNPTTCSASGNNVTWDYHSLHCTGNEMNISIMLYLESFDIKFSQKI